MLPSPSFDIPSIGTPHHAMDEDQMINPTAMAAQQQQNQQHDQVRPRLKGVILSAWKKGHKDMFPSKIYKN